MQRRANPLHLWLQPMPCCDLVLEARQQSASEVQNRPRVRRVFRQIPVDMPTDKSPWLYLCSITIAFAGFLINLSQVNGAIVPSRPLNHTTLPAVDVSVHLAQNYSFSLHRFKSVQIKTSSDQKRFWMMDCVYV